MRFPVRLTAALAALALAWSPVKAADTRISDLPAAGSLSGNETVLVIESDGKTLEKATTSVFAQLAVTIHAKGAWSSSTVYVINDVVSVSGSSYIAIAANTNETPPNATYWVLLAQAGSNGTGTGTVTSVTCGAGLTGGAFTVSGTCALSAPVSVANGGTGATTASGVSLDNITGWATNGFVQRTGSGSYAFISPPFGVAYGGTGLATGNSGGVLCFTASTAIASSGQLGQYGLLLGGGSGACPGYVGSLGTLTSVLHGNASGPPSYGPVAYADIASGALATSSDFLGNTASRLATPNAIWTAATPVTLTFASTITPDLSAGVNFSATLTAAFTLGAPANAKPGETGSIQFVQDSTGGRTVTWPSAFKWVGGSPCVLSTAASAIDYVFYYVFSSSVIVASCMLNVH